MISWCSVVLGLVSFFGDPFAEAGDVVTSVLPPYFTSGPVSAFSGDPGVEETGDAGVSVRS